MINIRPGDRVHRRAAGQDLKKGNDVPNFHIHVVFFFVTVSFLFEVMMCSLIHVPGDRVLQSKNYATLKPQFLNTGSTKSSVTSTP